MKKKISLTQLLERRKLQPKHSKTLWTKKMIISELLVPLCTLLSQLIYQTRSIWRRTTPNHFYILSVISVWASYLGDIRQIKKDLKEWCITRIKSKAQNFFLAMFSHHNLPICSSIFVTSLMIKKWISISYSKSYSQQQDL